MGIYIDATSLGDAYRKYVYIEPVIEIMEAKHTSENDEIDDYDCDDDYDWDW